MSDTDINQSGINRKNLTLALAESCTGGMIASIITGIPGASEFFLGGVVTYSNKSKTDLLKVDPEILEKYGTVSFQTVEAMTKGAKDLFGADITVAVTGIAGPSGGSPEKPVGLVFIAVNFENETKIIRNVFKGSRNEIRSEASRVAVGMILDIMER